MFVAETVKRVEEMDKVVEESVDLPGEFLFDGDVQLIPFSLEMFCEEFDQGAAVAAGEQGASDGGEDGDDGGEE